MEHSEGSVDFYTLGIEYIQTFTDKGSVQMERLISAWQLGGSFGFSREFKVNS